MLQLQTCFVSVTGNVFGLFASQITQFTDQVRSRVISQFISGISRVLHKLLKYFHGRAICTFTVPGLPVLFVSFDLNLNDSEFVILSFGSYLQCCHKLPLVFV